MMNPDNELDSSSSRRCGTGSFSSAFAAHIRLPSFLPSFVKVGFARLLLPSVRTLARSSCVYICTYVHVHDVWDHWRCDGRTDGRTDVAHFTLIEDRSRNTRC